MKRVLSILICLCLIASLAPLSAGAAETTFSGKTSGDLSAPKLTRLEVEQLLKDSPLTLPEQIFDVQPSVAAPYAAGKLSDAALQVSVKRFNAMRRLAGLPEAVLDAGMCEEAQYAAVLQGAVGKASQTPERPADMDEAFYQRALAACARSNLCANLDLTSTIDYFMSNKGVASLGHRRVQLNPTMGKIGFGYAQSDAGHGDYVAEYVVDQSGTAPDYEFIAWPSSGYFPNNTGAFTAETAWSVTLNPEKYDVSDLSGVSVTLTRESDGARWSFSQSDTTGGEFAVDTGAYGVANCIIFTPRNIGGYSGLYTVRIDGLKTGDGQPVIDFTYQTKFFRAADPEGTPFTDVRESDWFFKEVRWATKNEITAGTTETEFSPEDGCTRAQAVTFLWRAAGEPEPSPMECAFDDIAAGSYYEKAVLWAVEKGITKGTSATTFTPEKLCTRAEIVSFLYRLSGNTDTITGVTFPDVKKDAYYHDAVLWAAVNGITVGSDGGLFKPDDDCKRSEIVSFLYRGAKKIPDLKNCAPPEDE